MLYNLFQITTALTISLLTTTLATLSFAESDKLDDWKIAFSAGTGAVISSDAGRSKEFSDEQSGSDEFYVYSAHKHPQSKAVWDIFLGAEWHGLPCWAIQFGFEYMSPAKFTAKGMLRQGSDESSSRTYGYRYRLQTQQLLLEGKFFYTGLCRLQPYLFLGIGTAFNKANHFSTDISEGKIATRIYKRHANSSFSYAVGGGIDFVFSANVRLGACYRFVDSGKIGLGAASIDTVAVRGTLSQSHFYSNQILAQLTIEF